MELTRPVRGSGMPLPPAPTSGTKLVPFGGSRLADELRALASENKTVRSIEVCWPDRAKAPRAIYIITHDTI